MNTEKITIFFLPFAGGSKYSYNQFKQLAPSWMKVLPLDLPGRGSRFQEELLSNVDDVVDDLFRQIKDYTNEPYAIYGHSMGATLAYLVTRRVIEEGHNAPLHLFLTGSSGPASGRKRKVRSTLPKQEFIEEVQTMGGSPDEVLKDASLMEFFEPILRSDFKVLESYKHTPKTPLNIPITIIIGADEEITEEEGRAWQKETAKPIDFRVMPGNHFFILDAYKDILYLISSKLRMLQASY